MKVIASFFVFLFVCGGILATIDLNFAELEYLADHLLPEECRRLVAAAHFKSYSQPKNLGKAENAIPKDVPCIQLLLHWNSAEGEGKGETHEVLEHRLRQMGKIELADWLGRTVFKQLGQDLEESLNEGLGDLANDSTTRKIGFRMPTLSPPVIYEDPKQWLPFDTICLALLCVLAGAILAILCFACWRGMRGKFRRKKKVKRLDNERYEMLAGYSSNSEEDDDKFDIREHESRL